MKRYYFSLEFVIFALISFSHNGQVKKAPNIILILADDLGYMDVNCFATRNTKTPVQKQFYETPNLNKLAEQGVAFSQTYSCPLCSPSRSSILTGKNASRLGFMTATAGSANTFYAQGIK